MRNLILTFCLLGLAGRLAAATLTVTPAATSNTFSGALTLDITGLTNGEQVQITRFLDLNGNGTIDPGEPLIDAFRIADGGGFVVAGVTNANVPYDRNPAAGAITTAAVFAPPSALGNVVGQTVFALSSPSGRFSPVTATLLVTNAAGAPTVSGVVYSNGVAAIPNALVVALSFGGSGNTYAGAAVADATGTYQLSLNPGSYGLVAVAPGYYADTHVSPLVTLTPGGTASGNLYLTNGSVSLSGAVFDAANLKPLGGASLQLNSGSWLAFTFTDTNGNYSAGVAPGTWSVNVSGEQLSRRAYAAPQSASQVSVSTAGVSNINFAVTKASALFYGRIADANGVGLAGVNFSASDVGGLFATEGISDADGYYFVAVPGGPSWWNWGPDTSHAPLAGALLTPSNNTNLASGQALLQNFTYLPAGGNISGWLKDGAGNGVGNVGIGAYATIAGTQFNTYVDTDANGNYSLPVAAGTWNVFVNCCGSDGITAHGLVDTNQHVVVVPPANTVLNLTVYPPAPLTLSGGVFPAGLVNQYYSFSPSPSGGAPPYNLSLAPGSGPLPPGLGIAYGAISGMPTNVGTYNFTLRVTDQKPATNDQPCSLTIDAPLAITPQSLPNGTVGVPYSFQFQATGGQPPYSWFFLTNSAPPPGGFTLSTNGLFSGTPAVSAPYGLSIGVNDFLGRRTSTLVSFTVSPAGGSTNPVGGGVVLFGPAHKADGSFQFHFQSSSGTNYTLYFSTNLSSWSPLFEFQGMGGPMQLIDPNAATSPRRFYRLKVGP